MRGPRRLDEKTLTRLPSGPGAYLLSQDGETVCYAGRAVNLRQRLATHLNEGTYSFFWFKETETDNGAFFVECREFHRYGKRSGLENKIHPAIPAGTNLPPCSEKGCRGEAD
jgi:hypothetical protein